MLEGFFFFFFFFFIKKKKGTGESVGPFNLHSETGTRMDFHGNASC